MASCDPSSYYRSEYHQWFPCGGGNGWRWGYGMFAILVPVCIAPAVIVLFWGDYRAKKLGGTSIISV
jgi:hypothetical protein